MLARTGLKILTDLIINNIPLNNNEIKLIKKTIIDNKTKLPKINKTFKNWEMEDTKHVVFFKYGEETKNKFYGYKIEFTKKHKTFTLYLYNGDVPVKILFENKRIDTIERFISDLEREGIELHYVTDFEQEL